MSEVPKAYTIRSNITPYRYRVEITQTGAILRITARWGRYNRRDSLDWRDFDQAFAHYRSGEWSDAAMRSRDDYAIACRFEARRILDELCRRTVRYQRECMSRAAKAGWATRRRKQP